MCESTLLGLRYCAEPAPITGVYIDDIGITESLIGQFITDQHNTSQGLFAMARSNAWRKIQAQIMGYMQPYMKADSLQEGRRVGQLTTNASNTQAPVGAGKYVGIRLKIDPQTTTFLKTFISDLTLFIDSSNTNVPVLVFDIQKQKLIETITYAEGSTEQYIARTYLSKRQKQDIAIVYESTMAAARTLPKYGSCTDCGGHVKFVNICPFVQATGVQLDWNGTVLSNVTNKSNTGGVTLNYNVSCDRDSWLCSIGNMMVMPLAYATAVELYDYALTISPEQRVNTAITLNAEQMVQARDISATKYNEQMTAVLKQMRVPDDRYCFYCSNNHKYVTMLP